MDYSQARPEIASKFQQEQEGELKRSAELLANNWELKLRALSKF